MNRLIYGCGYLGARVAARWQAQGDRVTVVTRSPQRATDLHAQGYQTIVADVTDAASLQAVQAIDHLDTLLFAVGYDRSAKPSIQEVYHQGFANAVAAAPASTAHAIYISTTGVYGPAEGAWVDEATAVGPMRPGAIASLAAERVLLTSRLAPHSTRLRLAGIYGPGRIPFLDRLAAGEPIPAPQAGWLNLIHVDDAAAVVEMLSAGNANHENGSQLLNVSDGSPVRRGDYYRAVAKLVGAKPPEFVAPPADSPKALRAMADKRICNRALLSLLPDAISYPSYQQGLAAILGNSASNG